MKKNEELLRYLKNIMEVLDEMEPRPFTFPEDYCYKIRENLIKAINLISKEKDK